MKFEQFLTEKAGTTFKSIINTLHKDCKPFLKDWAGHQKGKYKSIRFLNSGRNNQPSPIQKGTVRKDRRPKDTHQLLSQDLDDAFKKKFGFPVRSTSIFVTGDASQASMYNYNVFLIFPIGNYKAVWSKKYQDLYTDLNQQFPGGSNLGQIHNPKNENPLVRKIADDMAFNGKPIWEVIKDLWEKDYGEGKKGNWRFLLASSDGKGLSTEINIPEKFNDAPEKWVKKQNYPDNTAKNRYFWIPKMEYWRYEADNEVRIKKEFRAAVWDRAEAKYKQELDNIVSQYESGNVVKAIQAQSEIMLHCDTYYMIPRVDGGFHTLASFFNAYGSEMPSDEKFKKWADEYIKYGDVKWEYGDLI